MNAHPVPNLPTSRPPINGPTSVIANGRTNSPSAFASTSIASGTMLGTIEVNAGPKIACPTPYTTTKPISLGIVSWSASERNPTAPIAKNRIASPAIMRRRRSTRSESVPLASNRNTWGNDHAIPTAASAVGVFDSSMTCKAIATM